MTFKEIKELIKVFDNSELATLNIKDNKFQIELNKNSTQQMVTTTPVVANNPTPTAVETATPITTSVNTTATEVVDDNAEYIKSPMVGTFYQAPSPSSPTYAKVGDKIKAGQTVCIVEAMKIMNEIQAEFDCEILEVLVEDGQAVEFDTPLFKVKRV